MGPRIGKVGEILPLPLPRLRHWSGQFCDLAIIKQRENVQMPFVLKLRVGI